MERPPPPPPPFPFDKTISCFSDFPLFDPNFLLNYQSSSSYNNNLSSTLINDPSAVTVLFDPPTYNYPHFHHYSEPAQQEIHNKHTLQLLPPSQNDQNTPLVTDQDHQGIFNPPDTSTIFSQYKKLKFVFKKELKSSDVSPLGRIVIPKKEAEKNLPPLISREGISLVVRDFYSDQQWNLKYKFWSNNKSRMYVLENTEDFMKTYRLKKGDRIIFYLDEESYIYLFTIKRAEEIRCEKHLAEEEEEDVALDVVIENLRHSDEKEEEEANNLLTMGIQASGPNNNTYTAESSSSSSNYHQPGINFIPFL